VARVLLRIEGRDAAADDREATRWLWERAAGLVEVAGAPGVFNEALMELGATVCLPAPARPACGGCPWKNDCVAHREGREIEIPRAKKARARGVLHCGVAVVTRADGAVLIEQRPRKGMWAGMWQAPTVEMVRPVERRALAASIGLGAGEFSSVGAFVHQTTHRELRFEVFRARVAMRTKVARGDWTSAGDLEGLAFSSAQRKAMSLAANHGST
jgi:A/G-specific adenine glycosylase